MFLNVAFGKVNINRQNLKKENMENALLKWLN